jgi:hypothetical protein
MEDPVGVWLEMGLGMCFGWVRDRKCQGVSGWCGFWMEMGLF